MATGLRTLLTVLTAVGIAATAPAQTGASSERAPLPAASDAAAERATRLPASPLPSAPSVSDGESSAAEPAAPDLAETAVSARSASRLLRMLEDRPARRADDARPPGRPGTVAIPGGHSVFFGCPRDMLAALLAGATDRTDAVSALAIERETLALCRERQEVVTGIVELESELKAVLAASNTAPAAAAPGAEDDGTAASSVVARLQSLAGTGDAPSKKAGKPKRSYAWFSILGTPGRLTAGVSDGARAWWVREGDRLPGAGRIERIAARPPEVRLGGVALPHRRRPSEGGNAAGDGP